MNSHIDFRTLPANVPSICIPRVFSNIDEKRIRRVIGELNLGDIDRVDIISSKPLDKGEKFNRVFIHFARWNKNENANISRERLINGKEIKIIYDDPWFWKVSAYREQQTSAHRPSKTESTKKVSITFDSDEESRPKSERFPRQEHIQSSYSPQRSREPINSESQQPRRGEHSKSERFPRQEHIHRSYSPQRSREPINSESQPPRRGEHPKSYYDEHKRVNSGEFPMPVPRRRVVVPKLIIPEQGSCANLNEVQRSRENVKVEELEPGEICE
jgi:hypothetical protein